MSRSNHSIFDSNEEAALTLTLIAKGMIVVDELPKKMISGTSKVILEVSSRFLLQSDNDELLGKKKCKVIHNSFDKKEIEEEQSSKEVGEPGA